MANQVSSPFAEGVGITSSLLERNQRLATMQQQREESAALFPLKVQQEQLQNEQMKVGIVAQSAQNQAAMVSQQDQAEFAHAQSMWNQGNVEYNPTFRTPVVAAAWSHWKGTNDIEVAKQATITSFTDRMKKLNGEDLSIILQDWKPGTLPSPDNWSVLADLETEQKRREERIKIETETARQDAIGQRQENYARVKAEATSQGRMDLADERAKRQKDQQKYKLFSQQSLAIRSDKTKTATQQETEINQLYRNIYHEDPFTGEQINPGTAPAGNKIGSYDPATRTFKDATGNAINFKGAKPNATATVTQPGAPAVSVRPATGAPAVSPNQAEQEPVTTTDDNTTKMLDFSGFSTDTEKEQSGGSRIASLQQEVNSLVKQMYKQDQSSGNLTTRPDAVAHAILSDEIAKALNVKSATPTVGRMLLGSDTRRQWSPAQVVSQNEAKYMEAFNNLPAAKREQVWKHVVMRLKAGERKSLGALPEAYIEYQNTRGEVPQSEFK